MGYIDFSAAASLLSNRKFGVVPGTGANLTSRFQAMGDNAVDAGLVVGLEPGVYEIDNFSIKNSSAYDSTAPFTRNIPTLCAPWGGVTIKKRNSADNDYLIASGRWVSSSQYGDSPFRLLGITLDGNNIAKDVLVNTGYASEVSGCVITNGRRHGVYEPVLGKNGSTSITSSRNTVKYRNNRIWKNGFEANGSSSGLGGKGVKVDYSASCFITDYWFEGNEVYNNYAGNFDVEQAAGWKISGNHMWAHGVGVLDPSATYEARIGPYCSGLTLGPNLWEGTDGQTYNLVVDAGTDFEAGHQTFLNGKGALASFNGGVGRTTRISSSKFKGSGCVLTHGYSSANCELISDGNIFAATAPYAWSAGNTTGIIRSNRDRISGDSTIYSGRQRTDGVLVVELTQGVSYPGYGATLTSLSNNVQILEQTAGSDQTITLPATPRAGMIFTICRFSSATGYTNLTIKNSGGTTIATLSSAGTSCMVGYDGANWRKVF